MKKGAEVHEIIEPIKMTLAIIGEKLDDFKSANKKEHEQILEQVKKTNGNVEDGANRITKLEVWQSISRLAKSSRKR